MSGALYEIVKEQIEDEMQARENEGKVIGSNRVNSLNLKLSALGRVDDIVKAASDSEYQNQLFTEFDL